MGLPSGEFLSLEKLAWEFRDLFLQRLDALHRRGQLVLQGDSRRLEGGPAWQEFLEPLAAIAYSFSSSHRQDNSRQYGYRNGKNRAKRRTLLRAEDEVRESIPLRQIAGTPSKETHDSAAD